MLSELARIPDNQSQQYIENLMTKSDISSAQSVNDVLMENNQYKIKEKRQDLLKVMREADETSKKAVKLRNQAVETAEQIKQMCYNFSEDENNLITHQTY